MDEVAAGIAGKNVMFGITPAALHISQRHDDSNTRHCGLILYSRKSSTLIVRDTNSNHRSHRIPRNRSRRNISRPRNPVGE
ncbi:MAG TPA: hypothetical protein VID19_11460 [Candidatus Eremiobacteraceae bacterium]|jgi:hypothetical protein